MKKSSALKSSQVPYLCYTDGSSKRGAHCPGGWGFIRVSPDGTQVERFGSALDTQSMQMELLAIAEALSELPEGACAKVMGDSQTALEFCERTLPILEKNGWKNAAPLTLPIAQRIAAVIKEKRLQISWVWLRSHHGNERNERADELAEMGAREAKKRLQK